MNHLFEIEMQKVVERTNALANLVRKIKDPKMTDWHDPDPFFFDPMLMPEWQRAQNEAMLCRENCVRGFWGTAPIFIVGSRPSKKGTILSSPQAKEFYRLLHKHGLANAHLTDTVKAVPGSGQGDPYWGKTPDDRVQRQIFFEELQIVGPSDLISLDSQAATDVRTYLSAYTMTTDSKVIHTHTMKKHYTWLRVPHVTEEWESDLIDILVGIQERRADSE